MSPQRDLHALRTMQFTAAGGPDTGLAAASARLAVDVLLWAQRVVGKKVAQERILVFRDDDFAHGTKDVNLRRRLPAPATRQKNPVVRDDDGIDLSLPVSQHLRNGRSLCAETERPEPRSTQIPVQTFPATVRTAAPTAPGEKPFRSPNLPTMPRTAWISSDLVSFILSAIQEGRQGISRSTAVHRRGAGELRTQVNCIRYAIAVTVLDHLAVGRS
jgi:hypothetical protein